MRRGPARFFVLFGKVNISLPITETVGDIFLPGPGAPPDVTRMHAGEHCLFAEYFVILQAI